MLEPTQRSKCPVISVEAKRKKNPLLFRIQLYKQLGCNTTLTYIKEYIY